MGGVPTDQTNAPRDTTSGTVLGRTVLKATPDGARDSSGVSPQVHMSPFPSPNGVPHGRGRRVVLGPIKWTSQKTPDRC